VLKHIVAKRYAKALFDLAYSQAKGDSAFFKSIDLIQNLSETIQANPLLKNVLFNPSFSIEEKKKVLRGIVDSCSKEGEASGINPYLKNFFSILIKKNKLVYLPEIVEEIRTLKAGLAKTMNVVLTVPMNLSDDQKGAVTRKLEGAFHKKIVLTIKVSPAIVGGMMMQVGSMVFDTSLQARLFHLRNSLIG
jgi:F-type H+-transporting ATPase subunit delta